MKNKDRTINKFGFLILAMLFFNITINGQNPNDGYNLIKNGNLESGLSNWGLWKNTNAGFNATHQLASGNKHSGNRSAKIKITSIGNTSDPYKVHFYNNGGIDVKNGHSYQASVWIKSSGPNATAKITFRKNSSPYTEYAAKQIDLNTSWTMYSLVWDGNTSNTNNIRFTVELGSHTGTVFIDDAIITNSSKPSAYKTLQSSIIGQGRIKMQTSIGLTECLKLGNNSFPQGEQITLTAIPEPGYTFHKWGGASTSTSNSCNIVVDSNSHVNAYFKKTSTVDVDINYRNKVDWSIAGYEGTIPYVTTNIIDMTQPPYNCNNNGGQGTYNYNKIKDALSTAGSGWTVLYFPKGTYKIVGSDALKIPSNTILRGECKDTKLRLYFSGKNCFESIGDINHTIDVLSGLHLNSRMITVENSNNINDGDFIQIRQDNIPDLMYHAPGWPEQSSSEVAAKGNGWANRAVGEIARVIGKNGNTLYLDRGIHHTYSPHRNPKINKVNMVSNIGIENLTLKNEKNDSRYNIFLKYAYNSWVRNIESNYTVKGHVSLENSYHCEVRDSYFKNSWNKGSGGYGYGADMKHRSTSNLVENNIFYKLRHSMIISLGCNGNVYGFNFSKKCEDNSIAKVDKCNISIHGFYPFMNLFESNKVEFITSSDWNGSSGPGNTFFRNNTYSKISSGARAGIIVKNHSHYQNIIGNEVTNWTIIAGLGNKINVSSNCKGTNQHSNYYKHYNSYNINNNKSHTLKKSLYQDNGNFNYPYPLENIGLSLPYKAHDIQAYVRFKNNTYVPCLDPCENSSDTTELTQCGSSINIQAPTYDEKHILHGVNVLDINGGWQEWGVGAPDLYIKLFKHNGSGYSHNYTSGVKKNDWPPVYFSLQTTYLDPNKQYKIEVWEDDNVGGDDHVGTFYFQGNTTNLTYTNGSAKIKLNKSTFTPIYNWSNGATSSSTTVTQSGLISATVTDSEGCESKHNYNATLNTSPKITSQPFHQANCMGSTPLTLSVSATGGFNLDYQWYSNTQSSFAGGSPIPNANSSSYSPSTNIVGTEYLWCVVTDNTNSNCDPDTSNIVFSRVFDAVYITQQPLASQTVCQNGTAATLYVNYGSNPLNPGPIGLDVDWFMTTSPSIPASGGVYVGAGFSFTPPTNVVGTFYYYYIAKSDYYTGPCFEVTSKLAEVNVINQPTITSQGPSYQVVCQNSQATPLNIAVNGPSNILSYSWISSTNPNGPNPTANLIPGAYGNTYSPPTNTTGTFYYFTNVSVNAYGCNSISSNLYTVDVKVSPSIDGEPNNYANWRQVLCLGSPANVITAYGNNGNYGHQWYHNTTNSFAGATPITGATLDNYTPNGYPVGNHYFFCIKTDLSVNACPPCTTQVYGLTVINSSMASFNYNIYGSNVSFQNISPYATSYFWDFGDGTSSTIHSPTHYYADGQYTATLFVNTPCGPDTISQTFTINTINQMANNDGEDKDKEDNNNPNRPDGKKDSNIMYEVAKIKIYPNPLVNQSSFTLSVNSNDLGSIKIYDSMLNCLKSQTLNSSTSNINVSQLASGIYTIVWQNTTSTASQNLVIQ